MSGAELAVLVVDDDFRVAELHAGTASAVIGFRVVATVGTLDAARAAVEEHAVDLALVDVYLPDGSGIDFVRELRCDAFVLGAATEGRAVRDAMAAGALVYLVKPFTNTELARRLGAYAHYRRIVDAAELDQGRIDSAVAALRSAPPREASPQQSVTRRKIVDLLARAPEPLSAAEVAAAIGISRATAQRYLAALVAKGRLRMQLRYGSTGRPEQEYAPSGR
ncbi:response regulator [Rhodococcus triatomae]|uniref:Transcriptional regulatory protein n=1 Tax=Rhodococcus triatomae TaxID=300028 RepID=A0A1G8AUP7_9NOCA|nr:response regulator [Rhodococcus triatomae]QNG17668.1 response regulator [Rhodococcus triatomae]QNG22665.1 response regulator [Rhodococcus triatomae]SDH24627.1 Response regulator of citrate/malate metabolism [Rhodococcus triatomae]